MEEKVDSVLRQMQGKDDLLCDQVTQLLAITSKLSTLAPKWDFSDDLHHNGIRSFVTVVQKFIHLLCQLSSITPSSSVIRKINSLRRICPLLLRTAVTIECSTKRPHGLEETDFTAQGDSLDRQIIETVVCSLQPEEVEALHVIGVRNFYLDEDTRKVLDNYYFPQIPFRLLSPYQAMKTLMNSDRLSKFITKYSLDGTLYDIRSVWGAGDKKSSRMFMQWKTSKLKYCKVKKVHLSRSSSTWLLCNEGAVTPCEPRQGRVKCYLHLPSNYSRNKLIFYMHGGGYFALTSKSFEAQLGYVARKLNVAIISIDYGLVPENPFPGPLQDALDAYLAIVANGESSEMRQLMAGIKSTHIVLAGDSAGAHMAIGLSYALNEIRKQSDFEMTMPRAINIQFPATQLSLGPMSPSRCLMSIDAFLSPSILITAFSTANGILNQDKDVYTVQTTKGIRSGAVSYMGEMLSNEQSRSKGFQMIEGTLTMMKDPFWNLLVYPDIESLSNIPLYIYACEFDPLLDDSIALARYWKGPVTLQVAEGVMHGFPPFAGFSGACKKAFKSTIESLRHAFDATRETGNI